MLYELPAYPLGGLGTHAARLHGAPHELYSQMSDHPSAGIGKTEIERLADYRD